MNDSTAKSPLQQLIEWLEKEAEDISNTYQFCSAYYMAADKARSLLPTDQAAPKRDEEIEQLAKECYPDNMGGIDSNGVARYRAGYKGGYKAAMQSLEQKAFEKAINETEELLSAGNK
jgi:hypothetical protein